MRMHKLNCGSCKGVYIGQTGRNLETRIKEFLPSFSLKQTNSNYANHLLGYGHTFDNDPVINSAWAEPSALPIK